MTFHNFFDSNLKSSDDFWGTVGDLEGKLKACIVPCSGGDNSKDAKERNSKTIP